MGNGMSFFTQFGAGNIKSIQRGVTGSVVVSGSEAITISSVDTGKSILMNLGVATTNTGTFYTAQGYFELTNSTTITFYNGGGSNSCKGAWQIVEYY
jgi:hypothetical protein